MKVIVSFGDTNQAIRWGYITKDDYEKLKAYKQSEGDQKLQLDARLIAVFLADGHIVSAQMQHLTVEPPLATTSMAQLSVVQPGPTFEDPEDDEDDGS